MYDYVIINEELRPRVAAHIAVRKLLLDDADTAIELRAQFET